MLESIAIALLIMLLRATDVSLATMKTIFIVEGRGALAPSLGFFEATIYVIAASLVFRDLGNPLTIFGFGAGFALGTALGIYIAQRLGLGSVTLRLIMPGNGAALVAALRAANYRFTELSGVGRDGPVCLVQMTLRKRAVAGALEAAKPWLGNCFVTVGDEPIGDTSQSGVMDAIRQMPGLPWALLQRRPHP
jgi:uncharacterized protein YebE (UPF0316 family)